MKVLVIGGGGREHAICKKIAESSQVEKLFCIPGNSGIAEIAECANYSVMDFDNIVAYSILNKVDLVVVAPDDPLSGGLVDKLTENGIRAFGPNKNAAIIEGSKAFSKDFMRKYSIPTAGYENFDNYDKALAYLQTSTFPLVIKADGLALGKGVIICNELSEGEKALSDMMINRTFGAAGNRVVIEEFLIGKEVSLLVFTDGKTIKYMPSSQDHKRAFDDDKGLNTGGMGAFSPSKAYTDSINAETIDKIIQPTIDGMNAEGRQFKGVLYFGLMLTDRGVKLLEYNARFGDPETQELLLLLKTDIVDIFNAVIDEKLNTIDIEWENKNSLVVVLASGGYPESFQKGYPITIGKLDDGVCVYHAGTTIKDGVLCTNGGRVLCVACTGDTIEQARELIYKNIENISFENMRYRHDIGIKL